MIHFESVYLVRGALAPVLQDVSFAVERGEFVCIQGEPGSGKSAILSLIVREELPSGGVVRVDGVDVGGLSRGGVASLRRRVALLHRVPRLLSGRPVVDNVAIGLELQGVRGEVLESRVRAALEDVGLWAVGRRRVEELSEGQRGRVALARALAMAPEVLLVDEPLAGLAAAERERIVEQLDLARHRGVTVVVATHSPELLDLESLHRIALEGGRVVDVDRPRVDVDVEALLASVGEAADVEAAEVAA